jgi:Uri superfamily endonuclease
MQSSIYEEIIIGSLGVLPLQPGYYAYTGSAFGPGGLRARISHHLKPASKPHWHIDYLRQEVELEAIGYTCSPEKLEHKLAEYLHSIPGLTIPLLRFGASDCCCPAHLFYSPALDTFQNFFAEFTARQTAGITTFAGSEFYIWWLSYPQI